MGAETVVIELMAGRNPAQARDFFLAWDERRSASWANAARDARERAASDGHLPQLRGQLRHHLGELALKDAAQQASLGAIPMPTVRPGGTFTVARLGRFGLVSLTLRRDSALPRPSATRSLLSQPNDELDPQESLIEEERSARGATELAYLGCLVTIPSRRDPSAPAEMAVAVPNAALRDWIIWLPLRCVHALLSSLRTARADPPAAEVADIAFPTFRLPKPDVKDDFGA